MSRPPRPHYRRSVIGNGETFRVRGDYLPIDFDEFVRMQQELILEEAQMGITGEEGDFANTLMELSALLGHALGLYQDLYSREAYLSTAETTRSLVRHARRLAYRPDAGLSATGYAALTIGEGLTGTVPKGFALASSPRGDIKAQTFETLEDLDVDSARNEALPSLRERDAWVEFSSGEANIRLEGIGLELVPGHPGILMDSGTTWLPVRIVSIQEQDALNVTQICVQLESGISAPPAKKAAEYRLLANPSQRLHLFGWNADPLQFPPEQIRTSDQYEKPDLSLAEPPDTYGYEAIKAEGGYDAQDIYLSAELDRPLSETIVWASLGSQVAVLKVTAEEPISIAFVHGQVVSFFVPTVSGDEVIPVEQKQIVENSFSAAATALRLQNPIGETIGRSELAVAAPLLGFWDLDMPLLPEEPHNVPIAAPLELSTNFGEFRPGGYAVFSTLDGSFNQVVEILSLRAPFKITEHSLEGLKLDGIPDDVLAQLKDLIDQEVTGEKALLTLIEATIGAEQMLQYKGLILKQSSRTTKIEWVGLTEAPPSSWTYSNLRVLANVARISHGESVEEILGGSDGVTSFLRFELKKSPVTQLPGANGGEPAIEVRVNDVVWERVDDFYNSGPDSRHYQIEINDLQQATVIFGNGRNGAIPSSGKKHIRAIYRFGLGEDGNVDGDQINRIKKAHPLVERAFNPTATVGGAIPAGLHDLQAQATRYIRTFERAVSIQDHADVALLYPGIVRSAARMVEGTIEVIVATAEGEAADELTAEVAAFLEVRRDTELPLRVIAPDPIDIYLSIEIEHDPAYLRENIRLEVQDKLLSDDPDQPGLFAFGDRMLGQAAHRSHIYERVAAVEGVDFVRITRFALADDTTYYDLLRVTPKQWLRLQPQNLDLSIGSGGEK